MEALLHIKSENQGLWDIEVPWSDGFVLDPHSKVGFPQNLAYHDTLCISFHAGPLVGLFIHSNFFGALHISCSNLKSGGDILHLCEILNLYGLGPYSSTVKCRTCHLRKPRIVLHSNLSTLDHMWAQVVTEEKATRHPKTPPPNKECPYFELVGAVLLKQKNVKTEDIQNGILSQWVTHDLLGLCLYHIYALMKTDFVLVVYKFISLWWCWNTNQDTNQ